MLFNEIKAGARALGLVLHAQGSPLVIDQERQKEPVAPLPATSPTTTHDDVAPSPSPVPASSAATAAAAAATAAIAATTAGRPTMSDQPLPPPSLGGVQPVPGAASTSVTYTEGGEKTVPLEVIKRYFHWRLKVRVCAPPVCPCVCPCVCVHTPPPLAHIQHHVVVIRLLFIVIRVTRTCRRCIVSTHMPTKTQRCDVAIA